MGSQCPRSAHRCGRQGPRRPAEKLQSQRIRGRAQPARSGKNGSKQTAYTMHAQMQNIYFESNTNMMRPCSTLFWPRVGSLLPLLVGAVLAPCQAPTRPASQLPGQPATAGQLAGRLASQPPARPASQPPGQQPLASRPTSLPACQPAGRPASQAGRQPASWPASTASQPGTQPASQPAAQLASQPCGPCWASFFCFFRSFHVFRSFRFFRLWDQVFLILSVLPYGLGFFFSFIYIFLYIIYRSLPSIDLI